MFANVTQMPVDGGRRITVDWTIERFHMLDGQWVVLGRCRMWRVTRMASGLDVGTAPLGDAYEIVIEGDTIEGALRHLMQAAWTQCLEGKSSDDTEH